MTTFTRLLPTLGLLALLAAATSAPAFSPAIAEAYGLRVEIPELAIWTAADEARPVVVRLTNTSAEPRTGTVALGLLEPFSTPGGDQPFDLPAGQSVDLSWPVTPGAGVYTALYPVHATASFAVAGAARPTRCWSPRSRSRRRRPPRRRSSSPTRGRSTWPWSCPSASW